MRVNKVFEATRPWPWNAPASPEVWYHVDQNDSSKGTYMVTGHGIHNISESKSGEPDLWFFFDFLYEPGPGAPERAFDPMEEGPEAGSQEEHHGGTVDWSGVSTIYYEEPQEM